jgi:hypothetical protein
VISTGKSLKFKHFPITPPNPKKLIRLRQLQDKIFHPIQLREQLVPENRRHKREAFFVHQLGSFQELIIVGQFTEEIIRSLQPHENAQVIFNSAHGCRGNRTPSGCEAFGGDRTDVFAF